VRELSRLRIPLSDISLGPTIDRGGFGTVNRGLWQGNAVAVKTLDPRYALSRSARASLHAEVLAMCTLRHPCIALAYGTVRGDGGGSEWSDDACPALNVYKALASG
jgi:serine/threonine protein kinase